ncbi:MAG TPA: asparagine synthase (glutamine-hydrolyzing) [Candidatus Acidoferrum sp.]|jgi:asparagine synthase (glutamine-hydrolysing)
MCGIAGIVALDSFDPQTLVAMTHLVRYRGPSGFGFAFAKLGLAAPVEIIHNEDRLPSMERPIVGLGSRRLAILDVSSLGNQPMLIEDGDYCVAFNGEIYNYKEIRTDLESLGYQFRTGSDTEVLLRSYQEWGEECLQRFNGMWGFALWDRKRQRLFCSRDRFGVKPFYYAVHRSRFFFGSEIKQVLLASKLPRIANPETVYRFLEWGLVDYSAQTFFQGVFQLPAGHSLTLDLSQPLVPIIRRYWELRVDSDREITVSAAIEEFHSRFADAVKIRLRSDVPVGVCLSGGLDSSAILSQAAALAPETQLQTFSACFEDKAFDEREYIGAMVSTVGCIGHSIFPKAAVFWKKVESVLYHQDEPTGSTGSYAQWCVMEDAHNHGVPVVLGGQGADEILCGYQKYRYFYLLHLLRKGNPRLIRESFLSIKNGTKSYWTLGSAARYFPSVLSRQFSSTDRLCNPTFHAEYARTVLGVGAAANIPERQKIDLTYSSIPALLHSEDRNSMAHSVESRLPFLDYKLAEFAVNCPTSLKLRDGWSKWILRQALKGVLPDKVRLRKTKLGFNPPESQWMLLGLQNGHGDFREAGKMRMDRFLMASKLAVECNKFFKQDHSALPANTIFRAMALELWAQVHEVS